MTKKIYLALLSILGFASACAPTMRVMYGTPSAVFRAKITVTNESNEPISNASISSTINGYTHPSGLRTDADGTVSLSINKFLTYSQKIVIYAEDIDGELDGVYRKDSVVVEVNRIDYLKDDGSWDGNTLVRDAKIVMKNGE